MRRDVHLDIGTKVISSKTGDLGEVVEPFYMARPDPHEICVHWDKWKDSPDRSECVDRDDIEYEGNGHYEEALLKWGHLSRGDYAPGDQVVHRRLRQRGTVIADERSVCAPEEVLVRLHGDDGGDLVVRWDQLLKFSRR